MKKVFKSVNIVAFMAILGGILLVLNFMEQKRYARMDFTANKEFTLSKSTKKVLKEVDDLVNLTVYMSENLPPEFSQTKNRIQDMLVEFRSLVGSNLEVKYVDPKGDEELAQKLQRMGVPQTAFMAVQQDNYQQMLGYLSIVLEYGGNTEVIPRITLETLEYDLVVALKKVLRKEPLQVGLYKNVEDPEFFEQFRLLRQALESQYGLNEIDINLRRTLPPDLTTLVVLHPAELSEYEAFQIDQYIMNGGKAVFLMDPIDTVTSFNPMTPALNSGLKDMLASYGVEFHEETLMDTQFDPVSYQMQMGRMIMQRMDPYPMWPKFLRQTGSFGDSPILSSINSISMRWPGHISLKDPLPGGVQAQVLIKSGEKSWVGKPPVNLNPQQDYSGANDPANQKTRQVAVLLNGTFTSYFKDKEIPDPEMDEEGKPKTAKATDKVDSSPETAIAVVANSMFVQDMAVQPNSPTAANLTFVQNLIDNVTMGNDLISIRAKGVQQRPLKEVKSNSKKSMIKYGNIAGMPALIVVFALVRGMVRRKRKKDFLDSVGGR